MTRLLIIKPSSLGDIIHALQVAEAMRTRDPDLRVDWVARDVFAPLVSACQTVDRTFIFYRKGGIAAFFRLIRKLRQQRYDLVFDMQGLARSGLMALFTRGARKIGRADAREGARFCYTGLVPLPSDAARVHAVELLLEFCRVVGQEPVLAGQPRFRAPDPLPAWAGDWTQRPFVLLFPGTRRPEKQWPHFGALTRSLASIHSQYNWVWAGNESEATPDGMPAGCFFNLTGKTALAELPWLIERAALVVANDSGPMHIAAALQRSVAAIFGPTDPAKYGPYPPNRAGHFIFRAPAGKLDDLPAEEVARGLSAFFDTASG